MTSGLQTSETLPPFLKRYFKEGSLEDLELPRDEIHIIEHLLEYGDTDGIRWVKKTFSADTIAAVVRQSSVISPETANLWALFLNIPRQEIRCFATRPTTEVKKQQVTLRKLPSFLKRYFWEVDFDKIQLPRSETYVLERLLEYGNDDAIRWVKKTFPPENIAAVVRQSRAISPNTANLWALFLNIPREEIRCFSTRSLLRHGPFSHGWEN